MESLITTILQVSFGGVGAVIVTKFVESWVEARKGKKETLDKLRDERSYFRSLFLNWRDYAYHVRAVARDGGIPRDKLGDLPEDEK